MTEIHSRPTDRIIPIDVDLGYENSQSETPWFRITWNLHSKTRRISMADLDALIEYLLEKRQEKRRVR